MKQDHRHNVKQLAASAGISPIGLVGEYSGGSWVILVAQDPAELDSFGDSVSDLLGESGKIIDVRSLDWSHSLHYLVSWVGQPPVVSAPDTEVTIRSTKYKTVNVPHFAVTNTQLPVRTLSQSTYTASTPHPSSVKIYPTGDAPVACQSTAIITLWSGNMVTELRVLEWLQRAVLPACRIHLYWVDNSGGRLTHLLLAAAAKLPYLVTIIPAGSPWEIGLNQPYLTLGRHELVASLYNTVLPMVQEELMLVLEDDTIPPDNGAMTLLACMGANPSASVVAGVYRTRTGPSRICASLPGGFQPKFDQLPDGPFEVERTGFGFAVAKTKLVQACLPVRCYVRGRGIAGWDITLCESLSQASTVICHPGVKAVHLAPEVVVYEARMPQAHAIEHQAGAYGESRDYLSIVATVRDELDLVEWVEFHIRAGVQRFYVYDNESVVPVKDTLARYIEQGLVAVYAVRGRKQQIRCYMHFVETHGNSTQWAAFIDADEYLVMNTDTSVRDWLVGFEGFCGVGINWQMFGDSGHETRQPSVVQAYRLRAVRNFEANRHVKTIAQPRFIGAAAGNPHTFKFKRNMVPVDSAKNQLFSHPTSGYAFSSRVEVAEIQLNHYFVRSREDQTLKIKRLGGTSGKPRTPEEMADYAAAGNAELDTRAVELTAN